MATRRAGTREAGSKELAPGGVGDYKRCRAPAAGAAAVPAGGSWLAATGVSVLMAKCPA